MDSVQPGRMGGGGKRRRMMRGRCLVTSVEPATSPSGRRACCCPVAKTNRLWLPALSEKLPALPLRPETPCRGELPRGPGKSEMEMEAE